MENLRQVEQRLSSALEQNSTVLDLSDLKLNVVPDFVFEHDKFSSLNLARNNLADLPVGLSRMLSVKELDLSENKFTAVPQIIGEMSGLHSILLNNNQIEEIPYFLTKLPFLWKVLLSNNKISVLPNFFGGFVGLAQLNLSGNAIEVVPESLGGLQSLHMLEFADNEIHVIPDAICRLENLRLLNVSGNNIGELSESICGLKNLEALNLSGNQIPLLPKAFFQLKKLKFLSLGHNQISVLPQEVSMLSELEMLLAADNAIARLPDALVSLEKLKILILSHNGFTSFPEVVTRLSALEELVLSRNDIVTLPDSLGELKTLTSVSLWGNSIYHLPDTIAALLNLKFLDVSHNKIHSLPDFSGLRSLEHLDLSANRIEILPESVGSLLELARLNLSNNKLRELPESLVNLDKLKLLLLHGNEKLELPLEILGEYPGVRGIEREDVDNSPHSILSYYFARTAGASPLNETKLVVVGRGAVGKTSLLKRLIKDEYDPDEVETPGIEINLWNICASNDEKIRVHAWDFGGQEILHATHQFFFSERCLYLLVVTGRDGRQQADAEYWLQLIGSFGGDSKVIVVLNKSVQHRFDLNRQTLLEKYPNRIVDFCETDCATKLGISELKSLIAQEVEGSSHRKVPFPKIWFNIKEELAKMHADYFSWESFASLCRSKGEFNEENQQKLAGYLHALGIALNYSRDIRLADTHVLNPRWVTEGVYTLLRYRQGTGEASINISDLDSILDFNRYPRNKHDFLLRLMELYQLCFKLPQQDDAYLVPELLSPNQPKISSFLENADIKFFYSYSVLPEGLIPRFIVQTHTMSEGQFRWRSGVQLKWEENEAIVVSDAVDRFVRIYIKGARAREFLAIIRQKFEEQHRAFKGITISEKIPMKGFSDKLLDYRDLIKRENRREESFYPENMDVKVNVRSLLDGIETPAIREERKNTDLEREGRLQIVNNYHYDSQITHLHGGSIMKDESGKTIQTISGGTFNQSAVVANANTFNWQANIASADDSEVKQQLNRLSELVVELVRLAPPEVAESAEKNMEIFSAQVVSKKPDADYLTIAAKRLGTAATAVAGIATPIIETVDKIVKLIGVN